MQENLKLALQDFVSHAEKIYAGHVKRIILYGSYARGDFREDSDVDVMILVDLPQDALWEYRKQMMSEVFDINLERETLIVPMTVNEEHFQEWLPVYPFYQNVMNEGVELFAA